MEKMSVLMEKIKQEMTAHQVEFFVMKSKIDEIVKQNKNAMESYVRFGFTKEQIETNNSKFVELQKSFDELIEILNKYQKTESLDYVSSFQLVVREMVSKTTSVKKLFKETEMQMLLRRAKAWRAGLKIGEDNLTARIDNKKQKEDIILRGKVQTTIKQWNDCVEGLTVACQILAENRFDAESLVEFHEGVYDTVSNDTVPLWFELELNELHTYWHVGLL